MADEFIARISHILGDGYVVERELGAGMSRVVVAREVALGRRVVVKVLPADWAAGLSADRFRREVILAAGLQHPHIVPLLAAAESPDGTLYYTMPYVDGQSLRGRLKAGIPALGDSLRWLRDTASALAYAHARGVVHRDMKPDNILLSGGYALVADFGIAKALRNASATMSRMSAATDPITTLGMSLGTPAYMAPEQVAADTDADHRTDLYALGVIAYELLTGETPFSGSAQAILTAHLATAPEPLSSRRSGLPDALVELVMQCLAKEAAERPQSANEVVEVLEELLRSVSAVGAGSPHVASSAKVRRASAEVVAQKRRGRRLIGMGAAAAVGVIAVAAVAWPRFKSTPLVASRVAVATLRDGTPDSSLRELSRVLSDDITLALGTVDGSDVVAREVVAQAELRLAKDASLPQTLAKSLQAGLIVTGLVSAVGADSVQVRLILISGADGRVISTLRDVVAARADLRTVTVPLGQRLAGALATVTGKDFDKGMLPSGNPPLLAALMAVKEGLQLEASLREPDPDENEGLAELFRFDRAFAADTLFVQARLWFASAALRRPGGEALADSALAIVQEKLAQLTEYERALMDAFRADAGGNHELSVRGWRRAALLAPAWPNRWWLAMKLRDANRPREALAIFDSLGIENVNFRRNVPGLRHFVGDFTGEARALREERARAPSTARSLGFQLAWLQSLAALDSLTVVSTLLDDVSQLPAEPGSSVAYLLTRTSWELAAHGHLTLSGTTLSRAVTWCARRTATDLANDDLAFDCMEAYAYAGRVTALMELAEPALQARPDDVDIAVLGVLGLAAALRGERGVAEQFSARIEQVTRADGSHGLASWLRARVSAALGDRARAIELLEDSFARGAGWLQRIDLHRDPAFAKLRGDAAFVRLVAPQG